MAPKRHFEINWPLTIVQIIFPKITKYFLKCQEKESAMKFPSKFQYLVFSIHIQFKNMSLKNNLFFHFDKTISKLHKPTYIYAQRSQCFGINADLNIFSIFEFYCPISIISTKCSQTERRRSISYFWISYWGWSKLLQVL